MNKKDDQNHLKETRHENLLTLKRAIDNNPFDKIMEFNREWDGYYIIITHSHNNHVFSGVSFYLRYFDCESQMDNQKDTFNKMRFFLSEQISDEEIHHIL